MDEEEARQLNLCDRIKHKHWNQPWKVVEIVERGIVISLFNNSHKHILEWNQLDKWMKI